MTNSTDSSTWSSGCVHRVLASIAIALLSIIALLCFAGFFYNTVTEKRLARAHSVPGTFYTVDGRRMHIDCVGKGTPTVILESGIGDDWVIWQAVQPELSEAARVCSYDRFGLGGVSHPLVQETQSASLSSSTLC